MLAEAAEVVLLAEVLVVLAEVPQADQ